MDSLLKNKIKRETISMHYTSYETQRMENEKRQAFTAWRIAFAKRREHYRKV